MSNLFCFRRLLCELLIFLASMSLSAQDFEFRNSGYGIDICFLDSFNIDFGGSNHFPIKVDGEEFSPEITNPAEQVRTVPASAYSFAFKDGESYHFSFSYKHRVKGSLTVEQDVTYRKPKMFSISIGVNEKFSELPPLKMAQKSAAKLYNYSKDPVFFPFYGKGQSYLISSGSETPTEDNVLKRLQTLSSDMKAGDLLLFYFAGHGIIESDDTFSLVLGNGDRFSGNQLASSLSRLPEEAQKIVIVCSCYSRSLWASIQSVPNTIFIYAGEKLTQGDNFADGLMALLDKTKTEAMSFDVFSKILTDAHPGSGIFPFQNQQDYVVSLAPDPDPHTAKKNTWPNLTPTLLSVVPGAGQFYKKQYVKGACFTGGTVLLGSGIIVCESMRSKYLKQATQTYDLNVRNSLQSKANNLRTASTLFIVGTSAVYLWSILDAAIAPNLSDKGVNISPQGISYKF